MTKPVHFERPFEIRFTEIDRHWQTTPTVLFNLLQETALSHADSRERGPAALREKGIHWFLTRIHLHIERYPRWKEGIFVRTWPSNLKGLHAVREFEVLDESGAPIARATTRWVIVDFVRRRPHRVPPLIAEPFHVQPARAIDDAFEDLAEPESPENAHAFHVRLSDLDINQHANSASYIDWMLECAPRSVLEGAIPESIEIAFRREARAGESLVPESAAVESPGGGRPAFLHALRREASRELLAVGRSVWRA